MTNPDVTITVYDNFVTFRTVHSTLMVGATVDTILLKVVGHGERTITPDELTALLRKAV